MRLIDADLLQDEFKKNNNGKRLLLIDVAPTMYRLETTWLGNYCPYTCQHCGKHTDSKTPFCAWCGRRASNYEDRVD